MTREEIITTIAAAVDKGAYTQIRFVALPDSLRYGAESFWEPGYDYQSPDFWESYADPSAELIEAVVRYDLMRAEEEEE